MDDEPLTRQQASDAVTHLGWRYVLGVLRTVVPTRSLQQAVQIAAAVTDTCGEHADGHLRMDIRAAALDVTLQTAASGTTTRRDAELAEQISVAVSALSTRTGPAARSRSVQLVEIAIDATHIAAIRPFWKAVLGYGDEPGHSGPEDPLVDPVLQGPAIWFQQMDAPRPQRNRIHLDISVPHDEVQGRMQRALDAGGVLAYAAEAPAFWVLADSEGNEACLTTWQGRDT